MSDEDTDKSRDLFWNRRKPKSLLKSKDYQHQGRAAYAVIQHAFHLSKDPEEVEFQPHLGNTVCANITLGGMYEDEVVSEFLEIVEELTNVDINCTKITHLEDDFLGENKQFRVDIKYEENGDESWLSKIT